MLNFPTRRKRMIEKRLSLRSVQTLILCALEEDGVRLYWQPIFPIRDRKKPHMFEVLALLVEPDGSIHRAADFVPQAETLDIIDRVDRRIIEHSFARWRTHAQADSRRLLSINLSAGSVTAAMAGFIIERAQVLQVPAECITLEITETTVAKVGSAGHEALRTLSRAGFRLAMDDFGAGVTSLKQLRTVPLDYMKLDISLVSGLAVNAQDRELVAGLAAVARTSELAVIAEGVQDEACLKFLDACGVRYAQGFYLGVPVPFPELPSY